MTSRKQPDARAPPAWGLIAGRALTRPGARPRSTRSCTTSTAGAASRSARYRVARRGGQRHGFIRQLAAANHPVQCVLENAGHAVGVLGARDHHAVSGPKLEAESGHDRIESVLVDVWIEGRQQLELVVDRYVHRSGGKPRHGPDDSAVGRGAPKAARNGKDTNESHIFHTGTNLTAAANIPRQRPFYALAPSAAARCDARRSASATIESVGFACPAVGKTDDPAT